MDVSGGSFADGKIIFDGYSNWLSYTYNCGNSESAEFTLMLNDNEDLAGGGNADGYWMYLHEDGSYHSSDWLYLDGSWYYFDDNSYMVTGWQWTLRLTAAM